MKRLLLPLFFIVVLLGCIDPITFKYDGQVEHLAVQSIFTNQKKVHFVRLTITSPFGSPYNQFATNAQVAITSKEGENYIFKHAESGKYFSDGEIAAIPGHTYQLKISHKGKLYESSPITLPQANEIIPIDSIKLKFATRYTIVYGAKEKRLLPGYDILVDFKDTPNQQNFYRWSFSRIYEVETQPENYVEYSCRGCPRPAPKDCCKFCWITESDEILETTANDWLRDGQEIKNQPVMFIPFYQYMNRKLDLTLYQHSISQEAYEFFRALNNQANSTGSMFDAPPTELKGNLYNINDKNEKVIGFFEASVVASKNIRIKGIDIDFKIPPFDYPDDCRVMLNSTTAKLIFW